MPLKAYRQAGGSPRRNEEDVSKNTSEECMEDLVARQNQWGQKQRRLA